MVWQPRGYQPNGPSSKHPRHANEIMPIEPGDGVDAAGLADIEKAYVDFVYALADAG